ncbi:MAG: hypothetical protein E7504_01980 [Ruminococcus sp.]|nr:hypothetical protein [Ruminococcus sp.]
MKICKHCGTPINKEPQCPKCGSTEIKNTAPFLMLFIGAVLLLIIVIFIFVTQLKMPDDDKSLSSENALQETTGQESAEPTIPDKILGNGFYEVGVDIPAGEYVILADNTLDMSNTPVLYAAVYTSPEGNDNDAVFSGWIHNNTIIRVQDGHYVEIDHAKMYESSQESLLTPFENGGLFHVGRDIPPGTYRIISDSNSSMGVYKVYSDLTFELDEIRDHNVFSTNGSAEITLKEGEYLSMIFCCLSKEPVTSTEQETGAVISTNDGEYLGEGIYEVGVDIPAGEYTVVSDGSWYSDQIPMFRIFVYEDAEMTKDLYNGWPHYNTIIRLLKGQFIEVQKAYLYEVSNKSLLRPFEIGGLFHVGRDIPPGTYTITSDSEHDGYYRVFTDITMNEETMRTQGPIYSGDTAEITLNEGEYIQMQFCHLQ